MRSDTRRFQLLPSGVPAASGLFGDQAEPGGPADNRGAEQRTGAAATERTSGARGGQNATGPGSLAGHPVQEDLHEQARERLDTVRRYSGIYCY